ncbi:MAG: hypothetical protein LBJ44_07945 [Propionibacteriaceae bacterium]|nr:hypothetical protein [Propionibacteriaceae bacterium]
MDLRPYLDGAILVRRAGTASGRDHTVRPTSNVQGGHRGIAAGAATGSETV